MWTDPPSRAEARAAKLSGDLRAMGSAVSMYAAATGRLPAGLGDLMNASIRPDGQQTGPYSGAVPSPPSGWSLYSYRPTPDGTYTVSSRTDAKGRDYKRACSVKAWTLECEPNGAVRFSGRVRIRE